jgi:tRNA A37 threonylcarbamoyladenosine dehydratase
MWTDRTEKLIGAAAVKKLAASSVLVFGLGGVGSYATEALARAGIGRLGLCDFDRIDDTNRNRQLYALTSTVGRLKVEVAKERLLDINPNINLDLYPLFYGPDADIPLDEYDFVVDAVDNVTAKLLLARRAPRIISSMGTGNKLDPGQLKIADIYETSVCPLARVMRRELRARGIERLTVVYSTEAPAATFADAPGSMSFVPPVAGMLMASYVVRQLISNTVSEK